MMKRKAQQRGGRPLLSMATGLGAAILVSLAAIFLFALVIRMANLSDGWITPVNQFIKVASILVGTVLAVRGGERGWVCGLTVGIGYMALGILVFCAFEGRIIPVSVMLGDLGLGAGAGFLSGILAVSFRRQPA